MAGDSRISQLPGASTPLSGSELVALVQAGVTKQTTATALQAVAFASPPTLGSTTPGIVNATTLNTAGTVSVVLAGAAATLTNPLVQATNSVDNYTQDSVQNKSATANASADVITYPDNVVSTDLTGFMNMGVTSSAYAQAAYSVTGPNEGYLFASAPTGSGKTGNMVIATDATGTGNAIQMYTGGFAVAKTSYKFNLDKLGNILTKPQTAVPTLVVNGDMVMNLTSNTNLRISVRGSDGVTRVGNITLA
jgi:hypothetical protein